MPAKRISEIAGSTTMKIAARALNMKAAGEDIIDFSVGEPDFPTPQNIKDAAKRAIDSNLTKYTLNDGLIELRKAICSKLQTENNLYYKENEIIVSNGAKQALFNIVMSVVDPGDEVIIPAPYYVSYPEMVKIAGGVPVILHTKEENDFKLTPEELNAAITPKTKAVVFCNPSNPTGLVYQKEEIRELTSVLEDTGIFIISDEVYEKLVYDNIRFSSFGEVSDRLKTRTAVINGVSKAYAMTGWRIGYAAADNEIIRAASKIQSHNTSGASSISQYASLEALTGPQAAIAEMVKEFERRRDFIFDEISTFRGITCRKPSGAFYVFCNVKSLFGMRSGENAIKSSYDVADFLLENARVALVPGSGFGSDDHIRISYSTSMENIEEGLKRIKAALEKLQ